jgi:hypothetical protein
MTERPVAHYQKQHLHEPPIGGAALDLGGGELGVLRRDKDRGTQPRLAIEPFAHHPVVHRPAYRRRHVGVEQGERAVQHVSDGVASAEGVERLRPHRVEVRRRQAFGRAPIRPRRLRQVRRIAHQRERRLVDVSFGEMLAPKIVEIRLQRCHAGHGRMQVAIDRALDRKLHEPARALRFLVAGSL